MLQKVYKQNIQVTEENFLHAKKVKNLKLDKNFLSKFNEFVKVGSNQKWTLKKRLVESTKNKAERLLRLKAKSVKDGLSTNIFILSKKNEIKIFQDSFEKHRHSPKTFYLSLLGRIVRMN